MDSGVLSRLLPSLLGAPLLLGASQAILAQEPATHQPKTHLVDDSLHIVSSSNEDLLLLLTDSAQRSNAATGRKGLASVAALELASRRPYSALLDAYRDSRDAAEVSWIERVLSTIRGPIPDSGMNEFVTNVPNIRSYFALKYFARVGSSKALEILNANYGQYPVPSYEWGEVVELFGAHRYTPAARHMAESIGAFPDVGVVAIESLVAMFPVGRTQFNSSAEARRYWLSLVSGMQ